MAAGGGLVSVGGDEAVGRLLAVGRTSHVHAYGPDAVVKIPRPSVPDDWAAREARNCTAVRALGAPAPAVRGVVRIAERDAIVFDRVHGPSMWELLSDHPDRADELGRALAAVHTAILRVGVPLGLTGIVDRMASKIAEVGSFPPEERRAATRAVDALPRGAALLHGDLHPGNVLMGEAGPVVIDWFDAAVGHPVADVVRSSLLIRPFDQAVDRPHMPGAAPEVLAVLHTSYMTAMADVLAPAAHLVPAWEAVVAASRLAEEAEADDSPLLAIWRAHQAPVGA